MPKDAPSPEDILSGAEERLGAAQVLLDAGYWTDASQQMLLCDVLGGTGAIGKPGILSSHSCRSDHTFRFGVRAEGYIEELHGRVLASAKETREETEYHGRRVTQEEAEAAILEAQAFVEKVSEVLAELKRKGGTGN